MLRQQQPTSTHQEHRHRHQATMMLVHHRPQTTTMVTRHRHRHRHRYQQRHRHRHQTMMMVIVGCLRELPPESESELPLAFSVCLALYVCFSSLAISDERMPPTAGLLVSCLGKHAMTPRSPRRERQTAACMRGRRIVGRMKGRLTAACMRPHPTTRPSPSQKEWNWPGPPCAAPRTRLSLTAQVVGACNSKYPEPRTPVATAPIYLL